MPFSHQVKLGLYSESDEVEVEFSVEVEDFYNGAYYWCNGTFSRPLYGCGFNAKWGHKSKRNLTDGTYKSMAYRFLLGDSIPFHTEFQFRMEHGFENDCYEEGIATLYYYYTPDTSYTETDRLDIGNIDSVKAHQYYSENFSNCVCTSCWEGDTGGEAKTYKGRLVYRDGISSFNLKISPEHKHLLLRRQMEYSFPNQKAEVFVDEKKLAFGMMRATMLQCDGEKVNFSFLPNQLGEKGD